MKRMREFLLISISALLIIITSCDDPVLFAPPITGVDSTKRGVQSPSGVTASQGEKQSITLTWNDVPNSSLYYIYNAKTPLDTFTRCGETSSTRIKLNVPAGSSVYYSISSVSNNGTESSPSGYVRGTSLAQPLISDITDVTESESSVTWYMENVFENSYKDSLLYTVYCFNGSAVVAQVALEGRVITENRAVFKNLSPNTNYEYQVEAYLRGDQNESEKSDKMNAATARRFRPGAPSNLTASHGTAKDRITISFDLPDMVDIALGDNQYDPKPLYFVISKRFYSENGNNEYQKVCSYFGSIAGKGALFTGGYRPGATVTWSDTSVSRDKKYEYLVQSYVDDTPKTITSDASRANSAGWALSEGKLLFGNIEYTLGSELYTSATLPLDFEFDSKDETYAYNLIENIYPLEDGEDNDPDGIIKREIPFTTYNAIRAYVPTMNLTKKTTQDNPGRGVYSYAVEIKRNGELLDTVSTIGKKEISENTEPIIVSNFTVQDGYTNKFVLKWENHSNRRYTLYTVDANGNNPVEIGTVNPSPTDDSNATVINNYSFTYTSGVTAGSTCYFAIRPSRLVSGTFKQGQFVYAPSASKTLGIPELSLDGGASYGSVSVAWTEAQKADTYRVKYRYTGDSAYTSLMPIKKENLSFDAAGKLKYTFKPEGVEMPVSKAGKEIQLQVDALNEGLRAIEGGGEISTTSAQDIKTRLVGPADIGLSADKAASPQEINVSWNKITGADGYYVFRRKFNMNNTAEEGTETIVYYVWTSDTGSNVMGINMALDNNARYDTTTVKAAATLSNSRFTLKDQYMPDGDYNGATYARHTEAYRNQQNDMIRGNPYRYWVVPVIGGTDLSSIEFTYSRDPLNKNTDIAYYTIQEGSANIKYTGAAASENSSGTGFTFGLGQDVTATKGTYSSNGSTNDGIKVTWSPPPLLASVSGFSPRYTVYRRYEINEGTWSGLVIAGDNISAPQFIDVQEYGINYQYLVGIKNGSSSAGFELRNNSRFINDNCSRLDEKGRPNIVGFMLGRVKLVSVSRDARADGQGSFGELVTWSNDGLIVDGYTVWLLNRNVNNGRQWIECESVPGNELNVLIANKDNRLKVLRDYKHYYKVRSYMLNEVGNKIYGLDPMPSYTWTQPDSTQEPYVRWGARQVNADEFAAITALSIGTGMNWAVSSTAPDRHDEKTVDISESNVGYNREIKYSNSTPYFITINGSLHGYCTATQNTPTEYGADCAGIWGAASGAKDHLSTLTITGPGDANGMYSGTVKILRLGSGAGTGPYKVSYNGQNDLGVDQKHYRNCFTFTAGSKGYKLTRDFDWSPSGGIASTNKLWYPLSGSRAGWD